MARLEDWPMALEREINKAAFKRFEWGVNDCCLWTADVVKALTGVDYAVNFRGVYTSEQGAHETLQTIGKGTIKETITDIFGSPLSMQFAMRGDVVMAIFDGRETLGICIGAMTVFKTNTGIIQKSTAQCDCVWRIE